MFKDLASNVVKQAEEASREIEGRYKTLFDHSLYCIYVHDFESRFLDANEAALKLLGYTKEEITSLNFYSILEEDQLPAAFKSMEEVIQTGARKNPIELKLRKKNGDSVWVEAEASLIYREGKPYAIHGIARDITERKRVEEALRTEKERFQTVSENAPFGMLMIDRNGAFTYMNPKFREMFGYDLTDVPDGRTWFRKAYPDATYRHAVISDWFSDLEGFKPGERRPRTFTATCKGGTKKTINFISVQLETGEHLMTCEDISERRQAEVALRAEKQRFQTLSESAPFGMVMIDKDGTFRYMNSKFKELFGYDLSDVPNGKTWFRKAYPDPTYRHNVVSTWKNDLTSVSPGEKRPRTFKVTCKDGTEKIVNFIPVQLETGENLMACEDISDLKRTEGENAALQEQLRQSQKMEAVGQLAGGIAHDFNNLLTIIKGYSQLSLLELNEGDPLWGNMKEIQKTTGRAADLIHKLLAFSRRQILDMKVLDLNDILRDLDRVLRRIIGEDIELVTTLKEDLWRVKVDSGQMEQVIMNLAVNARDAMPSGGKLTIETANIELDETYARTHIAATPGRCVILSVSDNGVGMTPEVKERIFEPFFTTKEKGKGTGLGLSTVYGIVKQSGGNISFYSEPGQGTTCKIYLPTVDEPLEEVRPSSTGEELPSGSETILLVENQEDVRKLALRVLERQGYRVLEASNGSEALMICEEGKEPIHLILTDVVMPKMGGKELADRIKTMRPEIRVLFTSGFTGNAMVHRGILDSGIPLLQKPFMPSALAQKVREVLDR